MNGTPSGEFVIRARYRISDRRLAALPSDAWDRFQETPAARLVIEVRVSEEPWADYTHVIEIDWSGPLGDSMDLPLTPTVTLTPESVARFAA